MFSCFSTGTIKRHVINHPAFFQPGIVYICCRPVIYCHISLFDTLEWPILSGKSVPVILNRLYLHCLQHAIYFIYVISYCLSAVSAAGAVSTTVDSITKSINERSKRETNSKDYKSLPGLASPFTWGASFSLF